MIRWKKGRKERQREMIEGKSRRDKEKWLGRSSIIEGKSVNLCWKVYQKGNVYKLLQVYIVKHIFMKLLQVLWNRWSIKLVFKFGLRLGYYNFHVFILNLIRFFHHIPLTKFFLHRIPFQVFKFTIYPSLFEKYINLPFWLTVLDFR